MRLRVTKGSSLLLHFISGLEPGHFKLASGKGKGSGENHTIALKYFIFFFLKENLGQISWVPVWKKEAQCEKEACWGVLPPHLIKPWTLSCPCWRLSDSMDPAYLFKSHKAVWLKSLAWHLSTID